MLHNFGNRFEFLDLGCMFYGPEKPSKISMYPAALESEAEGVTVIREGVPPVGQFYLRDGEIDICLMTRDTVLEANEYGYDRGYIVRGGEKKGLVTNVTSVNCEEVFKALVPFVLSDEVAFSDPGDETWVALPGALFRQLVMRHGGIVDDTCYDFSLFVVAKLREDHRKVTIVPAIHPGLEEMSQFMKEFKKTDNGRLFYDLARGLGEEVVLNKKQLQLIRDYSKKFAQPVRERLQQHLDEEEKMTAVVSPVAVLEKSASAQHEAYMTALIERLEAFIQKRPLEHLDAGRGLEVVPEAKVDEGESPLPRSKADTPEPPARHPDSLTLSISPDEDSHRPLLYVSPPDSPSEFSSSRPTLPGLLSPAAAHTPASCASSSITPESMPGLLSPAADTPASWASSVTPEGMFGSVRSHTGLKTIFFARSCEGAAEAELEASLMSTK